MNEVSAVMRKNLNKCIEFLFEEHWNDFVEIPCDETRVFYTRDQYEVHYEMLDSDDPARQMCSIYLQHKKLKNRHERVIVDIASNVAKYFDFLNKDELVFSCPITIDEFKSCRLCVKDLTTGNLVIRSINNKPGDLKDKTVERSVPS